jgi:hypothetical protein
MPDEIDDMEDKNIQEYVGQITSKDKSHPAASTVQRSLEKKVNSAIESFIDSCTRKWSTALETFRFERSTQVDAFKVAGKAPSADEIKAFGERLAAEERSFEVEFNKMHKARVEKFRSEILKKFS